MAEAALVAVILAVAAGLIIGGVAVSFVANSKNVINKEACRANVFAAAKDPTRTFQVNQCYTKEAGTLPYSGKLPNYENEVSKGVADLLHECKYQFDDLPKDSMPWNRNTITSQRICFVCSTFTLPYTSPGVAFGSSLEIQPTFIDWLSNNVVGSTSYFDYLKPSLFSQEPSAIFGAFDAEKHVMNTLPELTHDESYAVVSFSSVDTNFGKTMRLIDAGIEKALGPEAYKKEEPEDYTHIFITPVEDLGSACEITFLRYP